VCCVLWQLRGVHPLHDAGVRSVLTRQLREALAPLSAGLLPDPLNAEGKGGRSSKGKFLHLPEEVRRGVVGVAGAGAVWGEAGWLGWQGQGRCGVGTTSTLAQPAGCNFAWTWIEWTWNGLGWIGQRSRFAADLCVTLTLLQV
jgi:hypothetical protein